MNAKVFAIRNKATKLYLPDRQGKGYSYDEPTSPDKPRLFWKRTSARAALQAWLRGRWVCRRSGGYGGYGGGPLGLEYHEEIVVEQVVGRNAADMEIVEFSLQEAVDAR